MVQPKKLVSALSLTGFLAASVGAPVALAQQNGLVNVSVGSANARNSAPIDVAARFAAQACGVSVAPVAVIAARVDQTGVAETVCQSAQGPVLITDA